MDDRSLITPAFSSVADLAVKKMEAAGGGALCVYLRGRPVLDIWAGVSDPATGARWNHDTMAMAWSTAKGISSTALHMLVERGQLAYDEPIATYWPEFAENGKAAITVRQFMSMEAGLYDIRHLIDDPKLMLDHDAMASALAAAAPAHPPGERSGYHAITYGWIAGELVRRVSGVSLGSFVRSEIAEPLNLDGFYIGTPADELARVAALPRLLPEAKVVRAAAKLIDPVTRLIGFSPARFAAAFLPKDGHLVIPTPEFLQAEVPGANGVFTARSLARTYAALGADDGLDGVRLWSPDTRRAAATQQNDGRDLILALRVRWRLGYHRPLPSRKTPPASFGFFGAYGSGAFADPTRDLAVGFLARAAKGTPLMRLVPKILAAADAS